jgi:hypothetical protein
MSTLDNSGGPRMSLNQEMFNHYQVHKPVRADIDLPWVLSTHTQRIDSSQLNADRLSSLKAQNADPGPKTLEESSRVSLSSEKEPAHGTQHLLRRSGRHRESIELRILRRRRTTCFQPQSTQRNSRTERREREWIASETFLIW